MLSLQGNYTVTKRFVIDTLPQFEQEPQYAPAEIHHITPNGSVSKTADGGPKEEPGPESMDH